MFFFTARQARSKDPLKRKHAAEKLGSNSSALDLLCEMATDEDGEVRAAVFGSLAKLGDVRALDAMLAGLKDSDKLGDAAATRVREAASRAFAAMGPAAMPALEHMVKDKNAKLREAAVVALGSMGGGGKAEALLTAALQDSRSNVRQAAINALAAIGDSGSVSSLAPALEHRDAATRKAAAEAVANLKSADAARALQKLTRDVDRGVREAAVSGLGRHGAPEAVEVLLAVFEGQDRELRQMAAVSLGSLNWQPATPAQRALHAILRSEYLAAAAEGDAAVEPLAAVLADKSAAARRFATEALGRTGSELAAKPLLLSLQDHDAAVRQAAADALVQIGAAAVTPLACAVHEAVQAATPDIVLRIGAAAAPRLLAHLQQGEPYSNQGVMTTRVEDEDQAEHAERAAHLLNRLLGGQPAAIDADCLRGISHLRDIVRVREVMPATRRESPTIAVDRVVDCRELRDRASAELQRRKG